MPFTKSVFTISCLDVSIFVFKVEYNSLKCGYNTDALFSGFIIINHGIVGIAVRVAVKELICIEKILVIGEILDIITPFNIDHLDLILERFHAGQNVETSI